jgi:hypothetical protein
MTRKRFAKLSMANGLSRNDAKVEALFVRFWGSYEMLYYASKSATIFDFESMLGNVIGDVLDQVASAFTSILATLSDKLKEAQT